MRLIIITAGIVFLSCAPTAFFNDGYDSMIVKKEHVYFSRPVVVSATHSVDVSADDSSVYLKGNMLFKKPLEIKASEQYKETVEAFCRDMRYVAAERQREWTLIDKRYHQWINSLFLDTSRTLDTLPDSLRQALADEKIDYLVVFHNFRSTFTQKSFTKEKSVGGVSVGRAGPATMVTPNTFPIQSTTGSLRSSIAAWATMYYKGKRIYSFNYKGKSELSLEPICRGIFNGFGL